MDISTSVSKWTGSASHFFATLLADFRARFFTAINASSSSALSNCSKKFRISNTRSILTLALILLRRRRATGLSSLTVRYIISTANLASSLSFSMFEGAAMGLPATSTSKSVMATWKTQGKLSISSVRNSIGLSATRHRSSIKGVRDFFRLELELVDPVDDTRLSDAEAETEEGTGRTRARQMRCT